MLIDPCTHGYAVNAAQYWSSFVQIAVKPRREYELNIINAKILHHFTHRFLSVCFVNMQHITSHHIVKETCSPLTGAVLR